MEPLHTTGSVSFSRRRFILIISIPVFDATGKNVEVYGTAEALGKVPGVGAIADLNDKREIGFVQVVNGVKMVELPNTYNEATGEWALRNDVLYVIPTGNKVA